MKLSATLDTGRAPGDTNSPVFLPSVTINIEQSNLPTQSSLIRLLQLTWSFPTHNFTIRQIGTEGWLAGPLKQSLDGVIAGGEMLCNVR